MSPPGPHRDHDHANAHSQRPPSRRRHGRPSRGAPGTKPHRVPRRRPIRPALVERTIYRTGLTPGEWPILDALDDASEYRIDLTIIDSFTEVQDASKVATRIRKRNHYRRSCPALRARWEERWPSHPLTDDGQSADVQDPAPFRTALLVVPVPPAPGASQWSNSPIASPFLNVGHRIWASQRLHRWDPGPGHPLHTDSRLRRRGLECGGDRRRPRIRATTT